jgi:DNA-binding SARP family transcriptional activator
VEHVQVRLLGPVDVTADGAVRAVPGLRRKALLAVLGLQAGDIVSIDRLVDVVWGEQAPATAVNTLQSHVSYLRRVLGFRSAIVAQPPGYRLDLPNDATDVEVAERLLRQARQSGGRAEEVAAHLRAALALWRGRPLLDVAGQSWLDEQAVRLDQLHSQVTQALIDARLALGEHADLVPQLERLAQERPFDEQGHAQLMLALYRAGRQADALAVYQRLRRTLGDELGMDPSPALRDLNAAILRQEASLDLPAPPVTLRAEAGPGTVPAQLPPAISAFAGRGVQLARLDAVLSAGDGMEPPSRPAVLIAAVSGTPGVGKTALAVHWAHRIAHRYPDGQLYVNLRGFDAAGSVLDPAEALRGFLYAFEVPAERIPDGLDAQVGLYRSLLAGKRVLVVLDNARDAEQVRPLLPGSPGCLVVVTSRNQLTPLVATEGAVPLSLDVLPAAEARDLLTRRLGWRRVANEPAAVDEIIARCTRLPLALAIVAARAATRPGLTLALLAAELRGTARLLDALDGGDPATNVRVAFSWSYHGVSPPAARVFRLLGLHPGPDASAAAAASLAGLPLAQARTHLAELARVHLLTEHRPGAYSLHDLLRVYAAELAGEVDSDAARRAAVVRLLDHYLHSAHAADRQLFPHRDDIALPPAAPGVAAERPDGTDAALAWFAASYPALVAAIRQAAAAGLHGHTWRLAWCLATFLSWQGHWPELAEAHRHALTAAQHLADPAAEGYALRCLGIAYSEFGRLDDAIAYTLRALDLARRMGDPAREAQGHLNLARFTEHQGRFDEALGHSRQALDLYRVADDRPGVARALNNVGWGHALLGEYPQALSHCEQALVLQRELGDREGEATTWDSFGYVHRHRGEHERAIACYRRALELYREIGDRTREAETLAFLGDTSAAAGDLDGGRQSWRQALAIFEELGRPEAERVRAKLGPTEPDPEPTGF